MSEQIQHRGERLKAFFEHSKRNGIRVNLQDLMRKVGRSSKTIYNWFEMPDLPDDRIIDVASVHPEVKAWFPEVVFATPSSVPEESLEEVPAECRRYVERIEHKYYELLEKHQALMAEHIELLKSGQ